MFGVLKKIFGSKQDKDVRAYSPRIEEINHFATAYQQLSNDELRNKTLEFRARIADYLSAIDLEISNLKEQAEQEPDVFTKEDIYNEIDKKQKERNQQIEEILHKLLPEAFAVVKETARRFFYNESLSLKATDHDRDLSINKSYITLNGDQAVYSNKWTAAGGDITWNMIHYDVQLIGGMVLHDGKIAEMGTGEGKPWWQPCQPISTPYPAKGSISLPSMTIWHVGTLNGLLRFLNFYC